MNNQAPYYYGHAENKLNSKGQVALPARFRSVLPQDEALDGYVIIRGKDACLFMYTHRQFAKIKENVRGVAEETDDEEFFRDFLAEACPVDIDPQGRFVLSPSLMKAAGIQGPSILFVGVDDRIEIWEPGVFASTRGANGAYEEKRRKNARRIFGI